MAGGRPFSACGLQPNQGVLTGGVGPFLARRGLAAVRGGVAVGRLADHREAGRGVGWR